MVNSECHLLVTAKANVRKIMVMMHVMMMQVTQKRAKELLEKAAVSVGKADYKPVGP